MVDAQSLKIKIFADGADVEGITALARDPRISGFTTNPTLMRQSGISDFEGFARGVLEHVPELPISFEVFSDDFAEMERQARLIAAWGVNVYAKVPITNTDGRSAADTIRRLSAEGIQLNVTAVMTLKQVLVATEALAESKGAVLSVFAGRIADTGRDPIPLMAAALEVVAANPAIELLWASPREVLNIVQADLLGCHIVTVTHELLKKLSGLGRDLESFSLDTVKMFRNDAVTAGYTL